MPISILGLTRLRDGEKISQTERFQSLEDISLSKPIDAQVVVTKLSNDSLLVHTSAHAWLKLQCDRCLKQITKEIIVDFNVVFSDPADEDQWQLEGNEIDITEALRQEILFSLPMKITCEPECQEYNSVLH